MVQILTLKKLLGNWFLTYPLYDNNEIKLVIIQVMI